MMRPRQPGVMPFRGGMSAQGTLCPAAEGDGTRSSSLVSCPEPEAQRAACLLGVSWPQSCLQGAGGLASPPQRASPAQEISLFVSPSNGFGHPV